MRKLLYVTLSSLLLNSCAGIDKAQDWHIQEYGKPGREEVFVYVQYVYANTTKKLFKKDYYKKRVEAFSVYNHTDKSELDINGTKYEQTGATREVGGEVKFLLEIDYTLSLVTVTVAVSHSASSDVFRRWQKSIDYAWNNVACIVSSSGQRMPIRLVLVDMSSGDANIKNYTELRRIVYRLDTTANVRGNVTTWPIDDELIAAHEIGHTIGNMDEYGIVEGFDLWDKDKIVTKKNYSCEGYYRAGIECPGKTNIMGGTAKYVKAEVRHFNYVLFCAKELTGDDDMQLDYL